MYQKNCFLTLTVASMIFIFPLKPLTSMRSLDDLYYRYYLQPVALFLLVIAISSSIITIWPFKAMVF